MIKIIQGRVFYLGRNGGLFKDITDIWFKFTLQ